jgi:alkylation response protein AidB-like acyl-CoA dehydrogenase
MLPPTKERIADSIERLRPIIEKHSDEAEQARRQSDAVIQAIRDEGLLRLWAPRQYGGDEAEITTFMQVVEAIARIDASTAWVYANIAAGNCFGGFLPEAGAKQIWGDGPDKSMPGSVAPTGHAVPVPGGYKLSGRWPLSSGRLHGDWIGASSFIFEGDGMRMGPMGPDLRFFGVQPKEVQVIDTWHSLGLRGTGSNDFAVEDIFVPEELTFSVFTQTPQTDSTLYWAGILPLFSLALAPVLLGTARKALDSFVELAKSKTPTLSQTGLAVRPVIHAAVAKVEAQLGAARAYIYEAAAEVTANSVPGQMLPEHVEAKRLLACTYAAETSTSVVDEVFHLAGASSIRQGMVLERCLRDAHTANQHLLNSPTWYEKTGQSYFGLGIGMP